MPTTKYRCKIPAHLLRAGWYEITTPFVKSDREVLDRIIATQRRAGYDTMVVERDYVFKTIRGNDGKKRLIHLLIKPIKSSKPSPRPAPKPAAPVKHVIQPDPWQKRGTVAINRYGQYVTTAGANSAAHVPRISTDEQGYYAGR